MAPPRPWKLTVNGRVAGYFMSRHGAAIELSRLAGRADKENRAIEARIELDEQPKPRTEQEAQEAAFHERLP